MNEERILSPEEWMDYINKRDGSQWTVYDCNTKIMQRYANYVTKVQLAQIAEFRKELVNLNSRVSFCNTEQVIEAYDRIFNIQKVSEE